MRVTSVVWLAATLGCYQPPSGDRGCEILCTDACPGDLTCVNGTCVGDGQTCTPTFQRISAGNGFACALDARDLLWCWGNNANHQITADAVRVVPYATRVGNERWDEITTGRHVCGLREGALACWGANDRGQVSAAVLGDVLEPLEIAAPGGGGWSTVSAGFDETCGISDGRLYCWGANDRGQLGVGDTLDRGVPTEVSGNLTDWTLVSAGTDHSCGVSASAGLHCWGNSDRGQLGDGTATASSVPVAIALPGVTSVAVGLHSTCATANEQLHCWGYGNYGALGDPATIDPAVDYWRPTLASGLTGWTSVVSAEELACATRGDQVWCWGRTRGGGGLGNGVWDGSSGRYWGQIADGASALAVSWNANFDDANDDGTFSDSGNLDLGCVIVDGAVRCWGDNRFGQLAQGGVTMQSTPQPIAGDHVWTTLAAGQSHTCGIADGKLLCWGSTTFGQTNGVVAGTTAVPCGSIPGLACDVLTPAPVMFHPTARAVALSRTTSCALEGDVITCWGDNTYYQASSTVSGPTPRIVPGSWSRLFTLGSSGTYGQCAVEQTLNQTICWGGFMGGSWTATPTHVVEFDTMSSIGICSIGGGGQAFGCTLDQNQQLACYAANDRGQYGNGAPGATSMCGNAACDAGETCTTCAADCGTCPMSRLGRAYHAISVAGSQNSGGFTCGIRLDRRVECWGRNSRGAAGYADPATGIPPDFITTPNVLPGLASCTEIATASSNACAICDGELSCWGDHRRGAVGSGPITTGAVTTPRTIDVELPDGEVWAQVVLGSGYGCARTNEGHGYCWGLSTRGALGTGAASANLPIAVQLAP